MDNTRAQSEKFKQAAREAGADESEEHFKARLRKIATARVKSEKPPEPNGEPDDDEKPGR